MQTVRYNLIVVIHVTISLNKYIGVFWRGWEGGGGGEFLGKKLKLTKMYGQRVELSLVNQYTNVSTTES